MTITELPKHLLTLADMIDADVAEASERGGVSPEEVLALFGSMFEGFLLRVPEADRQGYWNVFKDIVIRRVGVT